MLESYDLFQTTLKQMDEIYKMQFESQISSLISKLNEMNDSGKFCYHFSDGEISFYKTDVNYGKLEFIAKVSYRDASALHELLNLLNIQPVERSLHRSMDGNAIGLDSSYGFNTTTL